MTLYDCAIPLALRKFWQRTWKHKKSHQTLLPVHNTESDGVGMVWEGDQGDAVYVYCFHLKLTWLLFQLLFLVPTTAPPTLKELSNGLGSVTNWYTLGVKLGLESCQLHTIEQNHPRDSSRCRDEMLACCLQSTTPPTWKMVDMKYQLVIVDVIFLYLGDQVHLEFGKGEISRVNEKLLCWGGFTSTVGI